MVLAVSVTEVVRSTFGLAAGPTAVGLVAVWLAQAVRRVLDWRRGDGPARTFDTADGAQAATLAWGLAPWVLLPILHGFYPEWPVWGSLAFPA